MDISRFEKAVKENGQRFLDKIFTKREKEYASDKKSYFIHMAGKFAAKEAVKKALPDGALIGYSWPNIEILNDNDGKPYVVLNGKAERIKKKLGISKVHVSIAHTSSVAISNAVVIK